jgi:SAP domain
VVSVLLLLHSFLFENTFPNGNCTCTVYAINFVSSHRKREAEGRKPGMSGFGIESGSDDDDSDDDDDDEDDKKAKPAAKAAPAPISELAAKKKAAAAGTDEPEKEKDAAGGPPKLKAMDIKKMNGDALKDHLKERGLDIQGQKKDLLKRLLDYEAARA